jgi:hypothetical protein
VTMPGLPRFVRARRLGVLALASLLLAAAFTVGLTPLRSHRALADDQTLCAYQPTPPGWVATRINAYGCGTTSNSITYTSAYVYSPGTYIWTACRFTTPVPAGWSESNVRTDGADCNPTDPGTETNNAATYYKYTYGIPIVNAGGIVRATDFSPTIFPGNIVAIFGGDLSCGSGSSVTVQYGSAVWGLPQNDPYWYQSIRQINATLPSSLPDRAYVLVTVRNCNGYSSGGYWLYIS